MKISLQRRHTLMVEEGAFSHQNCITGSRVTAILLNWWILPLGGASAVDGLRSAGLPRLVLIVILSLLTINKPLKKTRKNTWITSGSTEFGLASSACGHQASPHAD